MTALALLGSATGLCSAIALTGLGVISIIATVPDPALAQSHQHMPACNHLHGRKPSFQNRLFREPGCKSCDFERGTHIRWL